MWISVVAVLVAVFFWSFYFVISDSKLGSTKSDEPIAKHNKLNMVEMQLQLPLPKGDIHRAISQGVSFTNSFCAFVGLQISYVFQFLLLAWFCKLCMYRKKEMHVQKEMAIILGVLTVYAFSRSDFS